MRNSYLIPVIVLISAVFFATSVFCIKNKKDMNNYYTELSDLNKTIIENSKELERINEDIEYNSSKEYIEKVAREKLGFVMEDEIIFKEN